MNRERQYEFEPERDARSIDDPERELHNPSRTSRADHTEVGQIREACAGLAEVRRIRQVGGVSANVHAKAFADRNPLDERHVEVAPAGGAQLGQEWRRRTDGVLIRQRLKPIYVEISIHYLARHRVHSIPETVAHRTR